MYYKGNNIGLNYDAATSTWTFNNEPQDFIDTNAFSTVDPVFDYTPPPADDEEEEDTTCEEGYIYDNTLKQCVPDPAQNQYMQTATGGGNDQPPVKIAGTDRYTTNNNFQASDEEYENMSAEEFVENYKQRGMVGKDENGNLFIDLSKMSRKGSILDTIFGRYQNVGKAEAIKKGDIPRPTTEAEASVRKSLKYMFDKNIAHGDLNPNLFNFKPLGMQTVTSENFPLTKLFEKDTENYKIILPTKQSKSNTVSGKTGTEVIGGWGNKVFDTSHGVYDKVADISSDYNKKIHDFQTAILNTASKISDYRYAEDQEAQNLIDQQIAQKNKFKLLKQRAEAEKTRLQAEQERLKAEAEKKKLIDNERKMRQTIRDAEKKAKEEKKYQDTFTGGDSQGGEFVTIPTKEKGGYTGSTSSGTSLGSSLHGTGSYKSYKPPTKSSGGNLGSSVHGTGSYKPKTTKKSKTKRQTGPRMGDR